MSQGEGSLHCQGEAAMLAAARRFQERLSHGVGWVAVLGPMGAGKTTWVRGMAEAMAGRPIPMPSPTFAIKHDVPWRLGGVATCLHHYDWYRLADPSELWACGWEEDQGNGWCWVEWADRFPKLLSEATLTVQMAWRDEGAGRTVTLSPGAHGWSHPLIQGLQDPGVWEAVHPQCTWLPCQA